VFDKLTKVFNLYFMFHVQEVGSAWAVTEAILALPAAHKYARVLTQDDALADDCVSQALLHLLESRSGNRWMFFGIIHNECMRALRKKITHRNRTVSLNRIDPESEDLIDDRAPDPADFADISEFMEIIDEAVSVEFWSILSARMDGKNDAEIAWDRGLTATVVRGRMHRYRERIKERLEKEKKSEL
jgi:DNA-directed RNA polymerase specialized sigma24 family protein